MQEELGEGRGSVLSRRPIKVCLLSIGTELVKGFVRETNLYGLSKLLTERGFEVVFQGIVADSTNLLSSIIKFLLEKCDAIILSGGLGPTKDDVTRQAVAQALGRNLALSNNAFNMLKKAYGGDIPSEDRIVMAYLPEGATPIENKVGKAPGFYMKLDNKLIVALPGVPKEFISFIPSVIEILEESCGRGVRNKMIMETMRVEIPELELNKLIESILEDHPYLKDSMYYKTLVKEGYVEIIFYYPMNLKEEFKLFSSKLKNRLDKKG